MKFTQFRDGFRTYIERRLSFRTCECFELRKSETWHRVCKSFEWVIKLIIQLLYEMKKKKIYIYIYIYKSPRVLKTPSSDLHNDCSYRYSASSDNCKKKINIFISQLRRDMSTLIGPELRHCSLKNHIL